MGRALDEVTVLRAAHALEQELGPSATPPDWPTGEGP
jgi:Asp-tRNA(Asn)/Glu-tRNA(Gln) amidotransferase A subunit family amidase